MSVNNYTTPEDIFTIPGDMDAIDKADSIGHTMDRVKGTVMSLAELMASDADIPEKSVSDCLYGVYAQLKIMEKLIEFKPELEVKS